MFQKEQLIVLLLYSIILDQAEAPQFPSPKHNVCDRKTSTIETNRPSESLSSSCRGATPPEVGAKVRVADGDGLVSVDSFKAPSPTSRRPQDGRYWIIRLLNNKSSTTGLPVSSFITCCVCFNAS